MPSGMPLSPIRVAVSPVRKGWIALAGLLVGFLSGWHLGSTRADTVSVYRAAPRWTTPRSHGTLHASRGGDSRVPRVDIGARDPYDGEIATNFADKAIGGVADTFHVIKIPEAARTKVGLLSKRCEPLTDAVRALTESEATALRTSAGPGVLIVTDHPSGGLRLRLEWTVASPEKGTELMRRAEAMAAAEQWPVSLRQEGEMVVAEVWTAARAGVTPNDFILAAKLNHMDVGDLLKPRKRRIFA